MNKNKNKSLIILFSVFFIMFTTSQLIFALSYGDIVKVTGSNELPNLFYEHNLFSHLTEKGDYIYCVEPDKIGSENSIHEGIVTDSLSIFNEQQKAVLKSAALNGYPNVSIKDFTKSENQCITAMALRCLSMEYKNLTKGRLAEDYIKIQQGSTLAKLECRNLIMKAKLQPFKGEYSKINIIPLSSNNVEIPGNPTRIGRAFKLDSVNVKGVINLNCENSNISGLVYPKEIIPGETFYISVPKSETYEKINLKFQIYCNTDKDIVFIKANNSTRQSYVGLISIDKCIKSSFDFVLDQNISNIEIIKKDINTEEILPEAKFKIWSKKPEDFNDNSNLLGIYSTNNQGVIRVSNITKLGTYYFCEILSPIGYSSHNPLIELIDVNNYGITYSKTVYNSQKLLLETYIQMKGYKQTASNQPMKYEVFGGINCSNTKLNNFSINLFIPNEYFNVNNKIEIGKFIETGAYQIFYKDNTGEVNEVKKSYNDQIDYLLSNNNHQQSKNVSGIFTNDINDDIFIKKNNIKEVLIKLVPTSAGIEFTTPLFNEGKYSIYIKDNEKEYLLGIGFDGKKKNKFKCADLRSYRIVFDDPINIDHFTSGKFTSLQNSIQFYDLLLDTDKQSEILVAENLRSGEKNTLAISDLYNNKILSEGESIKNLYIKFKNEVNPGFKQKEPIYIYGNSNDFNKLCKQYFAGQREKLFYSSRVEVEGKYEGNSIKNGDEWDTGTYSKNLLLKNGLLPKTGLIDNYIIGVILFSAGNIILYKWRF
ncbi:MAG: prealbumin-like fold domain-containing protein [Firmicutes bacterium]|nr:prealbumin-like fold domain-containing protein [Bacillota bacterium]